MKRLAVALAVLTALAVTACGSGYSAQTARLCNAQWDLAMAEHTQAMADIAGDPAGLQDLKDSAALLARMEHEGCPNGPYPLKVPS